jgi:DNA helicase-2/ATP-dependent DNA helicase PcrA
MMKKTGRLVAVGDRNQAIYGFTGADSDALDLIAKAVNATLFPLTVSHRCPKLVIIEAQRYVSHIEASPSAPLGEVTAVQMKDIIKTAKVNDVIISRFNAPNIQIAW